MDNAEWYAADGLDEIIDILNTWRMENGQVLDNSLIHVHHKAWTGRLPARADLVLVDEDYTFQQVCGPAVWADPASLNNARFSLLDDSSRTKIMDRFSYTNQPLVFVVPTPPLLEDANLYHSQMQSVAESLRSHRSSLVITVPVIAE